MYQSKRSTRGKLSQIDQETKLDESQSISTFDNRPIFSRVNTINDHDQSSQGRDKIRSSKGSTSISPIAPNIFAPVEKQMQLFKQLPEARELLKSIPIEFRKKIRQVIKIYQSERNIYERQVVKLQLENKNHILRIQQQQSIFKYAQIQNPKELGFLSSCIQISVSNNFQKHQPKIYHQEVLNKNNQRQQQILKQLNLLKATKKEEIQNLNKLIIQKDKEIIKQYQSMEKLNKYILQLEQKLDNSNSQTKRISQNNKELERKIFDLEKSVRQKRSIQDASLSKISQKLNSNVTIVKARTGTIIQHNRKSSPDPSQRQRNKSLRQTIQPHKSAIFYKKQQSQVATSEVDSTEFGKQKVIQKRKIRKIFTSIVSATSQSQKKQILQKLCLQVGVKIKDTSLIFNTN